MTIVGRGGRGLSQRDAATYDVVDRLFREEQGRAVATLIRVLGDFDLAEEAVQDAFIAALEIWPDRGVPANPGAWITTTARNRAIDRLRRRRRLREKTDELARDLAIEAELEAIEPGGDVDREARTDMAIPDDRLRLDLHVLPPGAADGRACRADAPDARRPDHARDRAGLPGSGADARPEARPVPSGRSATPASPIASHRMTCCPSDSTVSSGCSI